MGRLTCPRCGEAQHAGTQAKLFQATKCPACDNRFFVRPSYLWIGIAALVSLGGLMAARRMNWPEEAAGAFGLVLCVAVVINPILLIAGIVWTAFREAKVLSCEACGRRMRRLEVGRGSIALTAKQMGGGEGPAEQCMECDRVYCGACYPARPNVCACGKRSMRLVKVRYES
jgi:hypothetical protein